MKHKQDNKTVDLEDIMIWSDDTWCYRYELHEMQSVSDDYRTVYFGTDEYNEFFENLLGE